MKTIKLAYLICELIVDHLERAMAERRDPIVPLDGRLSAFPTFKVDSLQGSVILSPVSFLKLAALMN